MHCRRASQERRFTTMFRGFWPSAKEVRTQENMLALAGLRNTANTVTCFPGQVARGAQFATLCKRVREHPRLGKASGKGRRGPAETLKLLSREVDEFLVAMREKPGEGRLPVQTHNEQCSTVIVAISSSAGCKQLGTQRSELARGSSVERTPV